MRMILAVLGGFFVGFFAALALAKYASPVESYAQLTRAREGIMQLAYDDYSNKRYQGAASIVGSANFIASYNDHEWGFWMPVWGAFYRANGGLEHVHVERNYNDPLLAYLLSLSGSDRSAVFVYESIAVKSGKSKKDIDLFAKAFLDRLSSTDGKDVREFYRN